MNVINRTPAQYVKMVLTFRSFSGQARREVVTVPFAKVPTHMDIKIRGRAIVRDLDSRASDVDVTIIQDGEWKAI